MGLLSSLGRLRARRRDRLEDQPVLLDSLISPLRYDIVVRARFFEFHREHRTMYRDDRDAYRHRAIEQAYFKWFTHVFAARLHPELLSNRDRLLEAYWKRVHQSASLFDSFERTGFDARYPVVLRTGRVILPTVTGKRVGAKVFAGNGCHRIALLLRGGTTVLAPGMFVVRREHEYQPLDNTHALLRACGVQPAEYFAYLSKRYASATCLTRQQLEADVAQHNPTAQDELQSVLAADHDLLPRDENSTHANG